MAKRIRHRRKEFFGDVFRIPPKEGGALAMFLLPVVSLVP